MFEFTVGSWNVHMGLHNDFASARDKENSGPLNDVVSRCVEIDADVLVLQEAWWWGSTTSDLVAQVADAIGGVAHTYVSPTPIPRYRASWTVSVITRLRATRLDDVLVASVGARERAFVRVQLDDCGVTIAGCHLDGIHSLRTRPRLWMAQRRQFRALCADHDVVVGDMNMWGPVIERDARPLARAVLGKTWPAWRPHSQIDHLLVSDRVEVAEAQVLPNLGSDHLPIRATLRANAAPAS